MQSRPRGRSPRSHGKGELRRSQSGPPVSSHQADRVRMSDDGLLQAVAALLPLPNPSPPSYALPWGKCGEKGVVHQTQYHACGCVTVTATLPPPPSPSYRKHRRRQRHHKPSSTPKTGVQPPFLLLRRNNSPVVVAGQD